MSALGRCIRTLRHVAGMSVEDAANRVPCSPSYLSRVESGKATPTPPWVGNAVAAIADRIVGSGPRPAVSASLMGHVAAVRHALDRGEVSVSEAASVLGLSEKALHMRLDGRTPFFVRELWTLAEHLGVSMLEFFPED